MKQNSLSDVNTAGKSQDENAYINKMKNWLLILIIFAFCKPSIEAASVVSAQDGDFFSPDTWVNNQIPDLSEDTIIIEHHLSFDQDIYLSGSTYLNIKFCGYLCGNSDLFVGQNVSVYNQGELFTAFISVQGYFLNHGRVDCNGLLLSGGQYSNIPLGYLISHQVTQDCINRYLPEIFFRIKKINDKEIVIYLKCYSEIDFGDNSIPTYSSDSITHSYSSSDSFMLSITAFCPCDTELIEQTINFSTVIPETDTLCNFISLFPNPNNGDFHVKLTSCMVQPTLLRVPLFNSIGQLIGNVDLNQNGEAHVNYLPDLESGIYYLVIPALSGVKTHKVVVIK
jgi:hypothetical protein